MQGMTTKTLTVVPSACKRLAISLSCYIKLPFRRKKVSAKLPQIYGTYQRMWNWVIVLKQEHFREMQKTLDAEKKKNGKKWTKEGLLRRIV